MFPSVAPWPAVRPCIGGRPVNGDDVRHARFIGNGWGYDAFEVDDLLRRVADAIDAGQAAGLLRENTTFRLSRSRGYDIDAVDWFFGQLRRREEHSEVAGTSTDPWRDLAVVNHYTLARPSHLADPSARPSWRARRKYMADGRKYLSEDCANAWRDFGQQPGMHLRWGQVAARRYELRTPERQTIASYHHGSSTDVRWPERATLGTGGRNFALQAPPARSLSPADVEIFDETGTLFFDVSGRNFETRARARVTFPRRRWLKFPVRGTQAANAIMTAVDEAGNKVVRYRINGPVEIVVHPDRALTDELALAIAISAPWLDLYFQSPHGGGG
jgi:DivIVA domain-containing protein